MKQSCGLNLGPESFIHNEELYPCVGFHYAKDVIVRISNYKAYNKARPLNDRSKEEGIKPGSCPFFPCADLCSFG